jgi:hypothetical protein
MAHEQWSPGFGSLTTDNSSNLLMLLNQSLDMNQTNLSKYNYENKNVSLDVAEATPHLSAEYPAVLEDSEYYMNSVLIPALAIFGVIGNLLNLAVLTCRSASMLK